MARYKFDIGTDLGVAGVMTFTFLESDDLIAEREVTVQELVEKRSD